MNTKKIVKLLLGSADSFDTNDPDTTNYRADTLRQIANEIEPQPEPEYQVGDWVEHRESKEQATIRRIMSYGSIEIEFAYSTESDIYQANDFHNDFRKLSPSEVIVKIGCLSGTVEKAQDYAYFLLWHSKTDCDYSMIKWDALDIPTRELVESLLKAQEVKNG